MLTVPVAPNRNRLAEALHVVPSRQQKSARRRFFMAVSELATAVYRASRAFRGGQETALLEHVRVAFAKGGILKAVAAVTQPSIVAALAGPAP
nr:hypothetical protein BN993_03906 [Virgibacillus halodenitrificans]